MPTLEPVNGKLQQGRTDRPGLVFQPLDKTSFIPLPMQILAQLEGMIRSGKLAEGAPMPSEEELSHAYGVSRPAARHALELLRNRGYVVRRKGRGTFVSRPRVEKNIAEVVGFTAEMEALGIAASARVLGALRRSAGAEAAQRLGIFRGTPVFCLRRVRLADGLPVAIEESCVEFARFPGIEKTDFSCNSLYRVLHENYGVRFTRVDEVLEAHAANRAEARLLEIEPRTSLLYIQRTVWGADGRPVETAVSSYRGDRYRAVLSVPRIKPE